MILKPLYIKISNPIDLTQLNDLDPAAVLWGVRHHLISFEQLVAYSVSNYTKDARLMGLACLSKDEYSYLGYSQLSDAQRLIVCDDRELHRRAADACFLLIIAIIKGELVSSKFRNSCTLREIVPMIQFAVSDEWRGLPEEAPYISDEGPTPEICDTLVMMNRCILEGKTEDAEMLLRELEQTHLLSIKQRRN